MTTADALPGDMPGLRAAALALIAERDELLRCVERMRQLIRQFQRAQFGRHSERLDPDQLALALEEREIASAQEQAAAEKQAPPPRPRSEPGKRKSRICRGSRSSLSRRRRLAPVAARRCM
jgi:hypothetical protein